MTKEEKKQKILFYSELVKLFWDSPIDSFFTQEVIGPVIGVQSKSLEMQRWRRKGLPFRKVGGRVLYNKKDVIDWIESHELITNDDVGDIDE